MSEWHRYTQLKRIGAGASARVYRAFDEETRSEVAVKVLDPNLKTDPISIERFRRELAITRHIAHPQVVVVYDLVESSEQIYLVMELLRGPTLKQSIDAKGPLDLELVGNITRQILSVLSACHQKNVIHRDLKPQNISIEPGDVVKLMDFGISRMTSLGNLTQTGSSLGSPEYMAPELFSQNYHDPRTDLYAIGVILYEMLTGELPFQGESLPAFLHLHASAPVPNPALRRPELPEFWHLYLSKLMAKSASGRYQSADEALFDLERRSIATREAPALPERLCIHCESPTPAVLGPCLRCGFIVDELPASVTLDLWLKEKCDPDRVREFTLKYFNRAGIRFDSRRQLLLRAQNPSFAHLLRERARKFGVTLEAIPNRKWGLNRALRTEWIGLAFFVACAFYIFGADILHSKAVWHQMWIAEQGPDAPDPGHSLGYLFYMAVFKQYLDGYQGGDWTSFFLFAGNLALIATPVAIAIRMFMRMIPLLATAVDAEKVHAGFDWVTDLVPIFKSPRLAELKETDQILFVRFLQFSEATADKSLAEYKSLRAYLVAIVETSPLLSEIETALGAHRERLTRAPDSAEEAQTYFLLEERFASLMNRRIYVQSLFYTVIGRTLALREALRKDDLDRLDRLVAELRADIAPGPTRPIARAA